jgi:hypothetical protein
MTLEAITPEAIAQEIAGRKEEIIKGITDNLIKSIGQSCEWSLSSEIGREVAAIVKAEMLEEIKASIQAAKPQILEAVKDACVKVAAEVGKAMVTKAASNMDGWNGREVMKKLFDR